MKNLNPLLLALCVMMAAAACLYCGKGFYNLVIVPEGAGDMKMRWLEQRYVFHGRNPSAVGLAIKDKTATPDMILPEFGPADGGYPPWAYFTGAIFLWPAWPAVRHYFAVFDLFSLIVLFWWGYCIGRPHGWIAGLTLGLCGLCMASYATTIALGQYGLVITALLALIHWLTERKQQVLPGVLFGVAMIKPIIPALFVFSYLFNRAIVFLVALAIYMLIADVVTWFVVGTDPLTMLRQMLKSGESFAGDSYGPLNVLLNAGIPTRAALVITAGVFGLTAIILAWRYRRAALLVQFAIAAVLGRLWTYHKFYDNLMVLFLLVALGELAIRTIKPLHVATFIVVLLSLLVPATMLSKYGLELITVLVWIAGLAVLLVATPAIKCNTSPAEGLPPG